MTEVGIDAARPQLGKLVQRAELGERVVITRRGRPSAVLSPYVPEDERHPQPSRTEEAR